MPEGEAKQSKQTEDSGATVYVQLAEEIASSAGRERDLTVLCKSHKWWTESAGLLADAVTEMIVTIEGVLSAYPLPPDAREALKLAVYKARHIKTPTIPSDDDGYQTLVV